MNRGKQGRMRKKINDIWMQIKFGALWCKLDRRTKLDHFKFKVFLISRRLAYKCKDKKWLKVITKLIWKWHQGCDHCGAMVGFNSVVSRFGFSCWPCHRKLETQELV